MAGLESQLSSSFMQGPELVFLLQHLKVDEIQLGHISMNSKISKIIGKWKYPLVCVFVQNYGSVLQLKT